MDENQRMLFDKIKDMSVIIHKYKEKCAHLIAIIIFLVTYIIIYTLCKQFHYAFIGGIAAICIAEGYLQGVTNKKD